MIVLDTQVWLWWLHDVGRLSDRARQALVKHEARGDIVVSVISVWEIAVKVGLGKLQLPMEVNEWYEKARAYRGITIAPLLPEDAIASTQLPGEFHKDPADRIILALARRNGAGLVTSDAAIRAYPHVQAIW
jgi:PIN domain nuclease of toxin-antitoxin system